MNKSVDSMNIVLLGPPGVGKGTYGEFLSKKYGIPIISTGNIFRDEIKKGSELGKKVRKYVDSGLYVPDDIVMEVLKERISHKDCKNGFFLDGVPRTIAQAEALEKIAKIDKVLNFVASDETIMIRLLGRWTCNKCGTTYNPRDRIPKVKGKCDKCGGDLVSRQDETREAIELRLKVYREKTEPLIDYYRKRGLLADINAEWSLDNLDKILDQCAEAFSTIK